MTGNEFSAALQANGWKITETARGMSCTNPQGGEFLYNGLQAVQFGTWHDVGKCLEVPLPNLAATPAELEEAFVEAIGASAYQELLKEQWLPFQGTVHLRMSKADAVARELKAAQEFLAGLNAND